MSQSLLKAEHVKISFGNVHALRDVSLEILPVRSIVLLERTDAANQQLLKLYPVSISGMAEPLNLMEKNWKKYHLLMQSIWESRLFIRILLCFLI